MDCVYGIENCMHSKCFVCGECTSGTQIHRTCWNREDNEVSELLAGASECLPTEEQEATAESLQRNTPISLQVEEHLQWEQSMLDMQTFKFEMGQTDLDIAHKTLTKIYPHEDFDSAAFQRLYVHKYLSSEMIKFEFFIAYNQWGKSIIRFPSNHEIRMRQGIVTRFNRPEREHEVFHTACIDPDQHGFLEQGYSKGLLTIEASNLDAFVELMTEAPNLFFCKHCDHYMFDSVHFYPTKLWTIPDEEVWPKCEHTVYHCQLADDYTYGSIMAHKLICVVLPQEPPLKKRRIVYEDSD